MTQQKTWASTALGIVLALAMLLVAASPVRPELLDVAGIATVIAAALGIPLLSGSQRITALVLVLLGIVAFGAASALSGVTDLRRLLSVNQTILAMLAAVSFIAALAPTATTTPTRLTGVPAVWRTVAVTHLLASVINFSAVSIVGDRLSTARGLRSFDAKLIVRSFGSVAFWSPFWAAGAVALSYAPDAMSSLVLACGALLAALVLGVGTSLLVRSHRAELAGYSGFAVSGNTLAVPGVLAVLVIVAHFLLPDVDLTINVVLASLVVALGLAVRAAPSGPRKLVRHVRSGLPRMRGELVLFASAGVFSVGLQALISAVGWGIQLESFSAVAAWVFVVAAVLLSLIGIHPLVTIAIVAALLPSPVPNPTLFALSAMVAWGAATISGALSALNLLMAGRFHIRTWRSVRENAPFVVTVVLLAFLIFWLCEVLTKVLS